jgi:hypothetical protein
MRIALLGIVAIGCGGHASPASSASSVSAPPPGAAAFPAARWVPARPSYVFASPTVAEAQGSVRAAVDLLGTVTGYDLGDVTSALEGLLGVDALHPDPLAAIGIDPGGSWAIFSDQLSPTVVVHLSAPDRMVAFLERQRQRGVVARAAAVDHVQVSSATLGPVTVAWAIDGDWMWIHFARATAPEDGAGWFTASHRPHGDEWSGTWAWARQAAQAAAGLSGFLDLHGALGNAVARAPDAVACAKLLAPVGRVALALEGDERHVAGRIAIDVGPTTALRSLILPAPAGWDAAASHAAIAAQWNLDLGAARSWLSPCLAMAGGQLAMIDETSVRAARGMLLGFDPGAMSGSGAVALDITSPAFFGRLLDRIPLRHTLERARTFGTYKGFAIDIPFSVTVEYVLDHKLALAALGEGLLARLVAPGAPGTPGASAPPPIFALDVAPPAMSAGAWETLVHLLAEQTRAGSPGPVTKRFVEHLLRWRDAHLAVTVQPTELVFTASGNRR